MQPRARRHLRSGSLPAEEVILVSDDETMGTVVMSSFGELKGSMVAVGARTPYIPVVNHR